MKEVLGLAGGDGGVFPLNVLRFWFWVGGEPGGSIGDIFRTTFLSFSGLNISFDIVPVPENGNKFLSHD
jgi:hypothetical protein